MARQPWTLEVWTRRKIARGADGLQASALSTLEGGTYMFGVRLGIETGSVPQEIRSVLFFFLHGRSLHYLLTDAKSLATKIRVHLGMLS